MNKIKFKLLVLIILFSNVIFAQNILISQGGTINVSGGETFYDAGGAAGNDGNTSYTITLMPPPGKSVCVDFTSFSSYESLDIFDGTNVTSTNIGSLKGNYGTAYNATGSPYNTGQPALGGVVQAELKPGIFCANNASGALTFRFTNSGSSQSTGWVGSVFTFINSTSGCTIDLTADKSSICPSQSAVLTATGTIGASALDNTFNAGVIGTGWNATPGGVAFVNVLTCQPNRGYNTNKADNTTFAWMQNVAAPRVLESNSFDVSNGGVVSFDFRAASDDDGGNGCEANDDKEGVYVQYSTDNGTTWVNMKLMFPSVESGINGSANIGAGTYVYNWNRTTIPIPSAAQTANTKFRWYQHQSTSGSQDSWGIDDVKIIRNKTVTLTITDLSTNSVIATTTTSATLSVTVTPASTTNYRATISDGTTSCFEDITINVNGGPATTITYPSSSVANTVTTAQNITLTNGPVTGDYTATPAGLSINPTTGAVTPNTSTPGTYTISVPTSCGTAIATLAITAASCSTCATATCVVTSITENSAALGQTNIATAINTAGDNLGIDPLTPGQSVTVCVPVTVVSNSILLGFKQKFEAAQGCGNTAEQVITYQLRPASNCNATPIAPSRTNASNVGSGFNPEWDNLAAGNYVLCFTLNVTALSVCNPVDLQGLGYYNIVPATVPCQDYQIKLYDDDATSVAHSGTTFSCSDAGVFLGPTTDPTDFDSGLPFQNYDITITAISGNLNNLELNRYDAGNNNLAERLSVTPGQVVQNYFLRPAPGQYYKLDKTNGQSGTYSYAIVDVISGATVASGTWTIIAGAESAASISLIPQGTAAYSGPGVTNGFDVTGVNDYTNDRGIGFFNPALAGPGMHTITYTWNNGLAAPNNCTLTRTKTVTVTGPSAPTTTNVSICSGTTATLTAGAITAGATVKWYSAATGGTLLFTGNPFITPILTATTSYWVTQTTGGCESTRTQVTVSITPGTDATYTLTSTNCAPGSITFSSVLPAATTFDWVSGPAGYTFPVGFTTPSTTNTSLTNLPAGTYCVDITSPNVAGGTVTTTLLTENFESNAPNWTIDNTGGNNIFVINNSYTGGTCTIGGVPFSVPAVPNQGAWATAGPQSKYLHIKATTTCGFGCAESAFPPANANFCSTASDQKFTLNTPLNTTGKTNVTVSFQFINKGSDVDDFGALEYSINGGTIWVQAGSNLMGKTTWFNQVTTLPAWNNQPSLLFRFRWKNDASSSSDPPLCIDEIIITAQETAVASCGSVKQECIVINPIVTPTISCGTSTTNSVQFTWPAVVGATSYTATHTINGGASVNDGTITSPFTISGLNPNDAVAITLTPVGGSGTCFGSATLNCTANACPTILTPSADQTLCLDGDPTALSVSTTFTGANAISFVYFSTQQTGSAMYTGGNLLGNVTPSTGAATYNPGVLGTPGSLPNTAGTYYVYAIANPIPAGATCRPFQEIRVVVNSAPLVPTITTTPATCFANGTATVSNYSSTETYTSTPAGLTVSSTGVISGFTCGTAYTITATNAATCSATSTSFTVQCQFAAPLVPTVTTTPATCFANGTASVTNYSAALNYTSTPLGLTVSTTGVISGFTCGTAYTITASNAATCSATSTSFTVQCQLAAPLVPTVTTTPATCFANGTATVSNYSSTETYTSTPAGLTVSSTGVISGFTCGTAYTITATNAATCSATSTSFTVQCQLAAPLVPTVTTTPATCFANGTASVSNYSATLTYTSTPTGLTVSSTGVISGFTCGTAYTITATNAATCSATSTSFTVQCQLAAPLVPTVTTTPATCFANGTASVSNYSATLTYTSTPTGLTVSSTGLISGFTCGTAYTITATNAATCSATSTSFTVDCQLVSPLVPTVTTTPATCLANGTASVTNYSAALNYTSTSLGLTVSTTGVISGFTCGTAYTITASNAATCSATSTSFTVDCQLATLVVPAVTTTAANCSENGTATVSNYLPGLTYTSTPTGLTVSATGVVSGFTCGTAYTITATNTATCSATSTSFTVQCQLAAPLVPTITTGAATCSQPGSSTITNYNAALTYIFTPSGPIVSSTGLISGMTAGVSYTVISEIGGCISLPSASFSINAITPIPPTFNQVTPVCQGATINIPTSSTNTPPIVGVWNLISSTANDVTYEFTPNPGQCALTTPATTMTIVVHPLPIVTPSVTSQSFCSGGTTNINLVSNVPGAVFYWTATGTSVTGQSGSVIGSGATSINQTLTLNTGQVAAGQVTYTIVAEANGCLGAPVTVVVTVNPIPNVIISPVSLTETICSGGTTNISFTGAINNTVYSWSVVNSVGVSGALNGVGTSINQLLTTTGLSQGTVVYEVTPSLNGCPGTPQRITVTVNPVPELFGSTTHRDLCSGRETTNILVSTFNAATVFNWVVEPNGVTGASAGTATGLSINIVQTLTTTGNVRGYVDYIITPVLTGCSGIPITVRVYVNPLPVVSLTDGTICVDAAGVPFQSYVLDSGLNDVDYDFVWTFEGNTIPGETSATHTATQVGTYTVVATNSTTNCVSNIASAVVTATNPATSLTVTQSEYFSDNATLVVTVTGGNGTLLYQLDQGELQESNVFTGVTGGTHTITVVDTQGCTYLTQEVLVIDYPKYFTPNGDGHNDTWNIIGLNQPDAKLYIFDRYGKLLKQLSATTASEGWNGIYNNEKLPSTDYWFTLDYTENGAKKQFKAHFSLIR